MFHVSKSEKQFGVLFVIIGKMANAFGLVCIYCELCERIRYGFEKISDKIYKLDWYTYPLEVQRLLPVSVHQLNLWHLESSHVRESKRIVTPEISEPSMEKQFEKHIHNAVFDLPSTKIMESFFFSMQVFFTVFREM